MERFSNIIEKQELLKDLLSARQQVKEGIVYSIDEARQRREEYLSKWK